MNKISVSVCSSGSRLKLCASGPRGEFRSSRKGLNQENFLFPLLRRLLARAGGRFGGITGVYAVRGPGRFTGIRIALTFGRALAALSGARLRGVTAFEVLAWEAFNSADYARAGRPPFIGVCLHAFKEEYYCQLFRASGRRPSAAGGPEWLGAASVPSFFSRASGPVFLAADEEEKPGIYSLLPAGAGRLPPALSRIRPASIAPAAEALGSASAGPLYLKPAKYELDRLAKKAAK